MAILTPARTGDAARLRHELDSSRILTECCEQSASCRVQLIHSEVSVHATFLALHDEGIELHLSKETSAEPLHPQAICCVSFPYGTSFCAFLGCLVDVRVRDLGERTVVATFPKQLTVTNLRQSFRVPVVERAGLETIVRTATERKFNVSTRDITEGGLEIEFDSREDHGLKVGMPVVVELKFRGEVVQRTAEIRRIAGARCGLAFGRPADDNGQRQAACIHGIVLSLQQLWLKSRLL